MAKLLRVVSQLGWLARCVSVRFVRRLTAWSRRDKARPTLPPGFCSGLISYPPRRGIPGASLRGVFRDSRPHTAYTDLSTYLRDTAYDLVPVPGVCAISSSSSPSSPEREFHKTGRPVILDGEYISSTLCRLGFAIS